MATIEASQEEKSVDRVQARTVIPWPLIGATLVSYVALFLYTQGGDSSMETSLVLPMLGLALIASRFVPFRIAHASWATWVLRIVGLGFVVSNFPHTDSGRPMLFDPASVGLVGMIWAIEAAIQAWRERPWGNPSGASLILLSTLALTAASTIGEGNVRGLAGNYVAYLTPVFLLFILLSFRALEQQVHDKEPDKKTGITSGVLRVDHQPALVDRRVAVMRTLALLGALAIGFVCWAPVHQYRQQISTWGNNLLENHSNYPEAAGLSTAPALGDMFNADGSPTRVLRIDHYNGDPHLRGLSFDTYSRGRWLPAEDSLRFVPAKLADLAPKAVGAQATVHCYVDGLREIVSPLNVAGIAPGKDVELERADEAGPVLRVNAVTPYTYNLIQAKGEANQGVLCPAITTAERIKCLNVPADIAPGVHAMARKIWQDAQAKATTPAVGPQLAQAKIDAVEQYILGHYTYSLTTHPGNGDKISNFLLHEHAAHCEYFASAGVMLLRILGVPSRYVTGYYAHESEGSSTVVRQRDSHAWTECWIDGIGWVTVDMTPGGGRPDKIYPPTPAYTRIMEWFADELADARDVAARFTPIELSAGVAGLAAAFYGLRWLITLGRGRRRVALAPVAYDSRNEALLDMAKRYEAFLARQNASCPSNQPWIEHLQTLRAEEAKANQPAVDISMATQFVRKYNALRFRKEFDAELAENTRATLARLIHEDLD